MQVSQPARSYHSIKFCHPHSDMRNLLSSVSRTLNILIGEAKVSTSSLRTIELHDRTCDKAVVSCWCSAKVKNINDRVRGGLGRRRMCCTHPDRRRQTFWGSRARDSQRTAASACPVHMHKQKLWIGNRSQV